MTINSIIGQCNFYEKPPSALAKYALEFEAITFDVFETLLRRHDIFRPADLFYEIGVRAGYLTSVGPADFARLRIRAERDARCLVAGSGRKEVRLAEIYDHFGRLLLANGQAQITQSALAKCVEIEVTVELEHLVPIESVKQLHDWAIRTGKTVKFISDFYAPMEMLTTALEKAGIETEGALLVSSEFDETKHSGELYRLALNDCAVGPASVLHVGDNAWSDGARALQANIAHLRVSNPAHRLSEYLPFEHAMPLPKLASATMARVADEAFGFGLDDLRPEDTAPVRRIGRWALAPLLLGMASWLYEEASKHGFTDYYFCSRDGLIMKRAFELYQRRFGKVAETHYLEVSRQVIYRAQAHTDLDTARALFVQNWDKLTAAGALQRWGLDPEAFQKEIEKAGFSGLIDVVEIGNDQGKWKLEALFDSCRQALSDANAQHSNVFLDYLKQVGIMSAPQACLVDIGWHGSLQRGLQLLGVKGMSADLSGRYLGLFSSMKENAALGAKGYLFSADEGSRCQALRASPSLVELLHTAPHGSVKGYVRDASGKVSAAHEDHPDEVAQHEAVIGPIQEEALVFIAQVLDNPTLWPTSIDPGHAFAGLRRVLTQPARDEADMLGNLRIAPNYGADAGSLALQDVSPAGYRLWTY